MATSDKILRLNSKVFQIKRFEESKVRTLPLVPNFQGVQLVSFDFFDTLVYRDSINHFGLWKRVSMNFYITRLVAEVWARLQNRLKCIPEITQSDLDNRMPKIWQAEFEIQLELSSLVVNPIMLGVMEEAVKSGSAVCIISDTHYTEENIRGFMDELGIPMVRVFTSSKYLKTKSTGLFQVVQEALGIDFRAWVHIGDNLKSDISSAQKSGIATLYYPSVELQLTQSGLMSSKAVRFLKRAGVDGQKALSQLFSIYLATINKLGNTQVSSTRILGAVFASSVSESIAKEIHEMHVKGAYDLILYSSRDGWVPFLAHERLFPEDPIEYFKTSRKLLEDEKYTRYLNSIITGANKVLVYDLGWRGSTARRIMKDFPSISWCFVYWQFLGKRLGNQVQLNPGGLRNRLRIWRSRDFLESIFTDESNGYERIGDTLDPIERIHDHSLVFKAPILDGALIWPISNSKTNSLVVSALIMESFCRFPSRQLLEHAQEAVHEINEKKEGPLVTTSWKTIFSNAPIQWSYGSRLFSSRNLIIQRLFILAVLVKEVHQRARNFSERILNLN